MKIVTVLGARPQFIKASNVSKKISENNSISEVILHTGQHFNQNMSDIFFNEMNLPPPDYNLEINQMNHARMTAKMIEKIEPILIKEKPHGVLVYGDTNSTLAGSLTAAKLNIPVFHVEAGLRSYNRLMPEEIDRVLTDHLSSLLFCPTKNSVNLLAKEGIVNGVKDCGDVMYDAFLTFNKEIDKNRHERPKVDSPYVIATIHRQENTDFKEKLASIFSELDKINNELKVVIPLHPRTSKRMQEYNIQTKIDVLPPVGYLSMLSLLKESEIVITDSGGVQKEAFFAKKKCITVREETEWTELLDIGVNKLTPPKNLYSTFENMINKECDFSHRIYGDGDASQIILDSILKYVS